MTIKPNQPPLIAQDQADLGFTYFVTKAGAIFIKHHDRHVMELNGKAAQAFLKKMQNATLQKQQHIMARQTGNYKRGNEKQATQHERNQ